MSVQAMASLWDQGIKPPTRLLVALALADHADGEGGSIYPSVARISAKTGLERRQVQRHMSKLRDAGVLVVVREATQHRPTEYRLAARGVAHVTPGPAPGVSPMSPLKVPGVTSRVTRGDIQGHPGVSPVTPEPSVNPQEPSITLPADRTSAVGVAGGVSQPTPTVGVVGDDVAVGVVAGRSGGSLGDVGVGDDLWDAQRLISNGLEAKANNPTDVRVAENDSTDGNVTSSQPVAANPSPDRVNAPLTQPEVDDDRYDRAVRDAEQLMEEQPRMRWRVAYALAAKELGIELATAPMKTSNHPTQGASA